MKKTSAFFSKSIMKLAELQQQDGSFLSFSSSEKDNFKNAAAYHTTFANSLILLATKQLPHSIHLQKIQKKIEGYLLVQKNEHWSWNYWARNSEEAKTMVYPDDLDDTFCALSALFSFDQSLINGSVMAHMVSILAATEKKEGGPYCTWLVNETAAEKWKDVDIAVNSNVAYFLSLLEIKLPNLDKYLSISIKEDHLASPYYPSEIPIIYFLSRFYKGMYKKRLIKKLISLKRDNESFGNPLETGFAISSLINFGFPVSQLENSINFLLKEQKNGLWEPYAYCIDPAKEGKTYYAGSSAVTTAFCLEAISLYEKNLKANNISGSQKLYPNKLISRITKEAISYFDNFDPKVKNQAIYMLKKMLASAKDNQIPLLPYYFSQALQDTKIEESLLIRLGTANILGWMAYTIYDDFLDDEGDVVLLSVGNTAFRYMSHIFETLMPEKADFSLYFHELMNKLDNANAWEMSYTRLKVQKDKLILKDFIIPEYNNISIIAEKSLGHALGPIAIMFALGYTSDSEEIKSIYLFFTNFIIAKQLNDDAHDWQEDLKKGHITPVVAKVLSIAKKKKIITEDQVSLKKILPEFQKLFWHEVIQFVCNDILLHIKKAKAILAQSAFLKNKTLLETLLIKPQQGAEKALIEQKNMAEFINSIDF